MSTSTTPQGGAGQAVRRFVVLALLFTLVTIAANGIAGLLARAVDAGAVIIDSDTTALATWLAFTLIAGPLAAVLWWFMWRGLASPVERASLLWGLYVAGMSTLSLVLGVTFLLSASSTLVSGTWDPSGFALGITWLAIWVWHRWMGRHRAKSPTRLIGGARILGYTFGIVVGTVATLELFDGLIRRAVDPSTTSDFVGTPWWVPVVQNAVWLLGGILVWWLHWVLDGGSRVRTGFATVMLVLVTGLLAPALAVSGISAALYVGLRLAFDRSEPLDIVLDPLGAGLGAASVGAILWAYYRLHLPSASPAASGGVRLVSAGVSLSAAASGLGIVVNALLAALATPLVQSDSLTLLLAGLSLLLVGGVVWWRVWRPLAPVLPGETGRWVYLVTVFGVSALVAVITLLVIGFVVFTFLLSGGSGASLLEQIRGALGLLIATLLVAGYHFSVWRKDRSRAPAVEDRPRTIGRVVLVSSSASDDAVRAIRDATGAAVTVWTRTDGVADATPAKLAAALEGVTGPSVLVIAGAKGVQVIPLER